MFGAVTALTRPNSNFSPAKKTGGAEVCVSFQRGFRRRNPGSATLLPPAFACKPGSNACSTGALVHCLFIHPSSSPATSRIKDVRPADKGVLSLSPQPLRDCETITALSLHAIASCPPPHAVHHTNSCVLLLKVSYLRAASALPLPRHFYFKSAT